jgi:hypothetical protein
MDKNALSTEDVTAMKLHLDVAEQLDTLLKQYYQASDIADAIRAEIVKKARALVDGLQRDILDGDPVQLAKRIDKIKLLTFIKELEPTFAGIRYAPCGFVCVTLCSAACACFNASLCR